MKTSASRSCCRSCTRPPGSVPRAFACRSATRARTCSDELQPVLHELDITWFEEAQGQQAPAAAAREVDTIAELDDPHVRLLVDPQHAHARRAGELPRSDHRLGLPDDLVTSAAARVARAGHGGSL